MARLTKDQMPALLFDVSCSIPSAVDLLLPQPFSLASETRRGRGSPRIASCSGKRVKKTKPFVLVVDDAEDNRDLYATYFRWSGFRVDVAEDGEQALSKINRRAPDVVLMDLAMPKLDGWEATRLIKSNPRFRDMFVIVITGLALPDELARARAAGADRILSKPFLARDLHEIVVSLLKSRDRPM